MCGAGVGSATGADAATTNIGSTKIAATGSTAGAGIACGSGAGASAGATADTDTTSGKTTIASGCATAVGAGAIASAWCCGAGIATGTTSTSASATAAVILVAAIVANSGSATTSAGRDSTCGAGTTVAGSTALTAVVDAAANTVGANCCSGASVAGADTTVTGAGMGCTMRSGITVPDGRSGIRATCWGTSGAAIALLSAGTIPYAVQRFDFAHVLFASFIPLGFAVVGMATLLQTVGGETWQKRIAPFAAGAVIIAAICLTLPALRIYFVKMVAAGYENSRVKKRGNVQDGGLGFRVEHKGRAFFLADEFTATTTGQILNELERISALGQRLFVGPEDLPLVKTLKNCLPYHETFWIESLKGKAEKISLTSYPIIGRTGKFLGAVAIFWEPKEE